MLEVPLLPLLLIAFCCLCVGISFVGWALARAASIEPPAPPVPFDPFTHLDLKD